MLHSQCKNACVLSHIDHDMFLLFDGKNDRCWIVLAFWDTFNIEIDCSVMRLSCLDELVNNFFLTDFKKLNKIIIIFKISCLLYFQKTYCYLCHSRDMISKEGPVFWWNLWLIG